MFFYSFCRSWKHETNTSKYFSRNTEESEQAISLEYASNYIHFFEKVQKFSENVEYTPHWSPWDTLRHNEGTYYDIANATL